MQDVFVVSEFGFVEGFFTTFYLILIFATFYLIRFFKSKVKSVLEVKLSGLYVLLILPMFLNIFNMWCLSGFLVLSESSKTWVFVAISTAIVATGIIMLNGILKAIEVRDADSSKTKKISLKKEEN